MAKSGVTWFRRKVLGPGKSEHNGQGAYEAETTKTYQELVSRMEDLADHPDVESYQVDEHGVAHLTLVEGFGCQIGTWRIYETLHVGFQGGEVWAVVS